MNDRIQHLRAQMAAVADELCDALHEQETSLLYRVKGTQVEFEQSIYSRRTADSRRAL